jgi:hypothetical protein
VKQETPANNLRSRLKKMPDFQQLLPFNKKSAGNEETKSTATTHMIRTSQPAVFNGADLPEIQYSSMHS